LKNVVIVGGGIAGLIASIQFARYGIACSVIEKKSYPFHRVCGEYISNEAVSFLRQLDVYPDEYSPPQIRRFMLSSITGRYKVLPLDMGGFGISRYTFDSFLYEKAKTLGVEFLLNTEVESVEFFAQSFSVKTRQKVYTTDVVLGAFGKRSRIDHELNRDFILRRSPYVGVKYHIKTDHPSDLIALHNFSDGYCGISNVEDEKSNLCYLTHRDNVRRFKSISEMEHHILFRNPLLKSIFKNSRFLFDRPEVINEISFETKSAVEDHILMIGDAAGMITPLCGNGMAMAIHSAKIASELVIQYLQGKIFTRPQLENAYSEHWRKLFGKRLWAGRQIQKLFGSETASNIAVNMAIHFKPLAKAIIRNTHGNAF
jgi:flavin-dependent dehydrogenase